MESITKEIREKAHQVCCDYIGGVWKNIPQNEIVIEKSIGGYVNLTLKLSLPPNYKPLKEEPNEMIMKIHLGIWGGGYFKQMTENIIAVSLAEKNLAPKVYGIFDGGSLNEFIIHKPLVKQDLRNPRIISAIVRKLAHLHSVSLPINKNPNKKYIQAKEFIEDAIGNPRNKDDDPQRKAVMENYLSLNPCEELKWLKEMIDSLDPPVVYCHGDLQINNILFQNNPDDPDEPNIHIIDYDLSGYNYRGADFAYLFNTYCFEMPCSDPPYFKCHWDRYPTLEERTFIFDTYLEEFEKVNCVELDREKERKLLFKETKVCSLFAFLYFSSFNLQMKEDTLTARIDILENANVIINRYKEEKKEIVLDK